MFRVPKALSDLTAELHFYNLKKTSLPQSWFQAVVCISTPRMYLHCGYFLVNYYIYMKTFFKRVILKLFYLVHLVSMVYVQRTKMVKTIFVFVKLDGKMKHVANVYLIGLVQIKGMMHVSNQMNVTVLVALIVKTPSVL